MTIPEEGKFVELREASVALAREHERAEDESVKRKGPKVKCGGCGSKTHQLLQCLKAGPTGLMKGCPKCNTINHDIDGCIKMRDLKIRFQVLVMKRGHMPAFATKKLEFHWATVFREWPVRQESFGQRRKKDPRLPWTPEFTRQQGEAKIQEYQQKLDEDGFTGARLPADPATRDWDAARKTFPARPPRPQAQQTQTVRPQVSQAEQIQEVRAQVQDVVNNNPAARALGATSGATVAQGPSTKVKIEDILDDVIKKESLTVEPGSAQVGNQDVQMADAAKAEDTKGGENRYRH